MSWDLKWYEVGDPLKAAFACCCPSKNICFDVFSELMVSVVLALAQARTNMDESAFLFNLCCMNPFSLVWLLRSAYSVDQHSMKVDCAYLCFIPCCYANQIYQTTAKRAAVTDGGANYNTLPMQEGLPSMSFLCMSAVCGPCAMASALDKYISMPWWRACLCVSPCAGVNILRYHYRLDGNEFYDCCVPICFPLLVLHQAKVLREAERYGTNSNRYLTRTMMHARMVIDTQTVEVPSKNDKGYSPANSPGNKQKVSPVKAPNGGFDPAFVG